MSKPGDVLEFQVLTTKPKSDEALALLKKIHSLVKPIMRKHLWTLPLLAEFFPKQENLLGVNINRGAKICIRLRPFHSPDSFYDMDSLVGTMLHEGPHDKIFDDQLEALFKELDALQSSGYSGEGFHGKGSRVGVGHSHDSLSPAEARLKSLKKLEEREKITRLLGKGGRLGGRDVDTKGKRPSDILADAAERRQKLAIACGSSGHSHTDSNSTKYEDDLAPEIKAEVDKAARESRRDVVDLTKDSDDDDDDDESLASGSGGGSGSNPRSFRNVKQEDSDASGKGKGKSKKSIKPESDSDSDIEIIEFIPVPTKRPNPSSKSKSSTSTAALPSSSSLSSRPAKRLSTASTTSNTKSIGWECKSCTFQNLLPLSKICLVCNTSRPSSTPEGWMCSYDDTINDHTFWSCLTCGKIKQSSAAP